MNRPSFSPTAIVFAHERANSLLWEVFLTHPELTNSVDKVIFSSRKIMASWLEFGSNPVFQSLMKSISREEEFLLLVCAQAGPNDVRHLLNTQAWRQLIDLYGGLHHVFFKTKTP